MLIRGGFKEAAAFERSFRAGEGLPTGMVAGRQSRDKGVAEKVTLT